MSYIQKQFERLADDESQMPAEITRMKLMSAYGETNWLNASPEQVERIKEILSEEA